MSLASREHLRGSALGGPSTPLTMLPAGRRCEEKGCLGGPTLLSRYNRETTCEACKHRHKAAREQREREAEAERTYLTVREALLAAMPGMAGELIERTGFSNSTIYKMLSRLTRRGEITRTGERGRGGRGRGAMGGFTYHRAEAKE